MILTFITNNSVILFALLLVLLGLGDAIIQNNKQKIYANLYTLIGDAEVLAKKGEIVDKFNYVLTEGYCKLPKIIKFFISQADIMRGIEYALNKVKAYTKAQSEVIDVIVPVKIEVPIQPVIEPVIPTI